MPLQFIVEAQSVQRKFNDLDVTDGCKIKLDVGDDAQSLYVHIDMREKNTWKGNIQGFMGNDNDARMGIGGCLVSSFGARLLSVWVLGTLTVIDLLYMFVSLTFVDDFFVKQPLFTMPSCELY